MQSKLALPWKMVHMAICNVFILHSFGHSVRSLGSSVVWLFESFGRPVVRSPGRSVVRSFIRSVVRLFVCLFCLSTYYCCLSLILIAFLNTLSVASSYIPMRYCCG